MTGRWNPLVCAAAMLATLVSFTPPLGAQEKKATTQAAAPPADAGIRIDSETFGGLEARPIGPAAMSGRVAAIDAVQGHRLTIYVGAASGGVWKSVDGGVTFKPVFDKHIQSIGAIRIDPVDTKTVWVGTGESWVRNSVSIGDGVYKTTDGGDSWTNVGLPNSEHIAKIVIDPQHPDTVYVAATGHLWDSNPERGLYRTHDGGKTWTRILFVDDQTGCADVEMDPSNSRVLYAAMWQFRRKPHTFSSGGPGSGLHKSTDGGDTWRPIRKGMPEGLLGRIAVAVAPSKPSVVYANVEAKKTAFFRSDDGGETWVETNSGSNITFRPFYFSLVVADPVRHERVYKPGLSLSSSDDGGHTFNAIAGSTHSDHHALWINPKDPEQMILGTDGGVYITEDRGNNWRFIGVLPLSQFYHVSVDMKRPYNVYGGLQDNGTWVGPSTRSGGIGNRHWQVLSGGDGFWAFVDPNDDDLVYVEYQGGNIRRVRPSTGETKELKPFRRADEAEFRFNWNTPIHVSAAQSGTVYLGSQFLFRSRDRGDTWERISPDLTTNDPIKLKQEESGGLSVDNSTAENHCTIYSIAESPHDPTVVWVGTDDGNLQLTRDDGKSWTNVAKKGSGAPVGVWVSHVEPSRHDPQVAYATFDGHATGDMKTHVYRTSDLGKTWQSIGTEGLSGYAHVVREDPVNPKLLFVGTELGLFITVDGGKQWAHFTAGLPRVGVRDVVVHPREHDLVIATHGRGVWIIDDLTPIRALTAETLAQDAAILPSRPAVMVTPVGEQRFDGDAEYIGRGLEETAPINYYLKKRHMFGDLKIEVANDKGEVITTLPGGKRRGINRVGWPMRLKGPKVPPAVNLVPQAFLFVGPRLPEGSYTVRLVRGKETLSSTITTVPDPRSTHTAADRAVQQETVLRLYRGMEDLTFLTDAVADARDQARKRATDLGKNAAMAKKVTALADRLETLRKALVSTREGGRLTGEEQLRERLGGLYGSVNGYDGRPTQSQLDYERVLMKELADSQARFETLMGQELDGLNAALGGLKMDPIRRLAREDWLRKQT